MKQVNEQSGASLNARSGAVALAVSAPINLVLHGQGLALGPLAYLFWLALSFGVWCYCSEMGAARPLNRAGLVLFAAAFIADTAVLISTDPGLIARARLVYAFATLGAVVVWSVAMMHRTGPAKLAGSVGAWLGAGALVVLVAAHLLIGVVTVFGFSQLFEAVGHQAADPRGALTVIDGVLCAWSLTAAGLLWADRLRSSPAA
jgi:hypothetical protein